MEPTRQYKLCCGFYTVAFERYYVHSWHEPDKIPSAQYMIRLNDCIIIEYSYKNRDSST